MLNQVSYLPKDTDSIIKNVSKDTTNKLTAESSSGYASLQTGNTAKFFIFKFFLLIFRSVCGSLSGLNIKNY
jgi:hypothetical protein